MRKRVRHIVKNADERINRPATSGHDDPMLCQMGAQRVHQLGLLRQQQFACPEHHGKSLLLRGFDWRRAGGTPLA